MNIFERIQEFGGKGRSPDEGWEPRPATEPTELRPGTPEKVALMSERVMRGESCFHADDFSVFRPAGMLASRPAMVVQHPTHWKSITD